MKSGPMRSNEERLARLHRRAGFLKQKREKRLLMLTGSISAVLLVMLVGAEFILTESITISAGSPFAGASMLSESVGGYVLTAVVSFAAAVAITLACIHVKNKNAQKGEETNENQPFDDRM